MQVCPDRDNQLHAQSAIRMLASKRLMWNRRRAICAGAAVVIPLALWPGVVLVGCRRVCPELKVPKSHFVKEGHTPQNRKVIIFVHGVMGDMDNTWENPQTKPGRSKCHSRGTK
jgi:hypothetical protein